MFQPFYIAMNYYIAWSTVSLPHLVWIGWDWGTKWVCLTAQDCCRAQARSAVILLWHRTDWEGKDRRLSSYLDASPVLDEPDLTSSNECSLPTCRNQKPPGLEWKLLMVTTMIGPAEDGSSADKSVIQYIVILPHSSSPAFLLPPRALLHCIAGREWLMHKR